MYWSTIILVVISFCTCSIGQYVLNQPSNMSANPGETVKITCAGEKLSSKYYVQWYQQTTGSAPRLLIYKDNEKASGTPDRFSGESSNDVATLTISGVLLEDEAVYYCYTGDGTAGWYIFGVGTQMDVLTGEVKPPTVSIYPPSEEELNTDNATLLCAITDFNPKTVTVEWHMDGVKQTNGVHISPLSKQSDHTYTKISFFTLPSSEYIKHEDYTCKVTHQGKDIVQTLKRSECA